jgi:hypothetical protein
MNNRIEQDLRHIKRRTRPTLGFKAARSAAIILGGIELIQKIRKGQLIRTGAQNLSLPQQFNCLAPDPIFQRPKLCIFKTLRQNSLS